MRTVGEVAALGEASLVSVLGPGSGHHLHALAVGRDPRPVDTARRRRSIGSQQALGRRHRSPEELDAILAGTVDRLARRLRSEGTRGHGRVCRTVVLRLRFADFTRATRSHTLPEATGHTATLLAAARELLAGARPLIAEKGLTLLGLSFTGLGTDFSAQLALPFDAAAGSGLDTALDRVRDRFGARSVTRGTLLRATPHLPVPQLPEDE